MSATHAAPEAPTTDPSPYVQLLSKLREVAEAIDYVEKRGTNEHHGYSYVQALDVIRDVRTQLLARNIIVIPGTVPGSLQHFTETGGKSFVTSVDLVYRFTDTDTGASVEVPWTAAGSDVGGDKGIYKAYTGGIKYALVSLFLLPMTNDPEHDALSAPSGAQAEPEGTVAKDAERAAAPRIPLDRAKTIADAAVAAQLASWGEDQALVMTPVLKAQLATMAVDKLGAIDVDQAETLEAFIAAEAQAKTAEAETAAAEPEAETAAEGQS